MSEADKEPSNPLSRFLDRAYRQVWAVHRDTGEWVFLERGAATEEMRRYTRRNLRCPVPGCTVEINARGRSKRDGFYHLEPAGHGEGEGEWHLQAKALLAEWAGRQPGVQTAREEETVHVPVTQRVRRADVMATFETGAKVAFEVEYKDYKPEAWRLKQDDYDSLDITCTWIFGHLTRYLRQPRRPMDWPQHAAWDRLRWVELTEAVARAGRPVLFINPIERAVVTAIQPQISLSAAEKDPGWWRQADQVGDRLAHPDCYFDPVLVLDSLDQCTLDPRRGLITPTMRRIEAERERIASRAEQAQRRAEALAAERLLADQLRQQRHQAILDAQQVRQNRTQEQKQTAKEYGERKRAEQAQAWETHPLRQRIVAARGAVPSFLERELPGDRSVYAHPAHWHSQLFADLVIGDAPRSMIGKTHTFHDALAVLRRARIQLPRDASRSFAAIRDFLYVLEREGFLDIANSGTHRIETFTVIADLSTPRQTALPSAPVSTPSPVLGRSTAYPPSGDPAYATWTGSTERQALLRIFGEIPKILADAPRAESTEDEPGRAITVLPVHWHAHIYLAFIHTQPVGYTFTLSEAVASLARHGLAAPGSNPRAAVVAFLLRLGRNGWLTVSEGEPSANTTYKVKGNLETRT